MLSSDAIAVLGIRSERDKVAVPTNRSLVSPSQSSGLQECLDAGALVWIDRLKHPAAGWQEVDVYLMTPEGRRSLSADHKEK